MRWLLATLNPSGPVLRLVNLANSKGITYVKRLLLRSSWDKLAKLEMKAGMEPDKKLLLTSKLVRSGHVIPSPPSGSGMWPVKLLNSSINVMRFEDVRHRFQMDAGMGPVMWLCEREMTPRLGLLPSSHGMNPPRLLLLRMSTVSWLRLAMAGLRVPSRSAD